MQQCFKPRQIAFHVGCYLACYVEVVVVVVVVVVVKVKGERVEQSLHIELAVDWDLLKQA